MVDVAAANPGAASVMNADRDLRVAFVGDSFVAGAGDPEGRGWVGRVVAAAFGGGMPLTPYNLGVNGQTSADVSRRWQAEVLQRLPADVDGRVVFSFGTNDTKLEDGRLRVQPDASVANLEHVLDRAHELDLAAFVVGPAPATDAGDRERRIEQLSSRFAAVASLRGVPYVEVYGAIAASAVWGAEAEAGDGAHPAAGGYDLFAELVAEPLLRWLVAPPR